MNNTDKRIATINAIKILTHDLLKEERDNLEKQIEEQIKKIIDKDTFPRGWTYSVGVEASGGINEMENYFWINLECIIKKDDKETAIENYVVDMFQQDFDKKTGNIHIHLDGKIQIWRNLIRFSGEEAGGEIRWRGKRVSANEMIEIKKGKDIKIYSLFNCAPKGESIYKYYHAPCNAHPVSMPNGQRNEKGWNDKPWGLSLKDIGINKIPIMDMAYEDYNTEELAEFFVKLINADIVRKIKEEKLHYLNE